MSSTSMRKKAINFPQMIIKHTNVDVNMETSFTVSQLFKCNKPVDNLFNPLIEGYGHALNLI